MKSGFYLVYAVAGYVVGLANIAYIVGFLADVGVPKGIGDGPLSPPLQAAAIDVALVLLFGLHHSATARTAFKARWVKIVPAPIERATYLYMTAVMSAVLVIFWHPVPIRLWDVGLPWAGAIYGLYLAVWGVMFAATFHFGHFSFFGVAQAWAEFRKSPPGRAGMTVRFLYALVRHPISLGWMVTPLITPHLTVGHLVFAAATFVYIMLATPLEEADLVAELGDEYREYRKRTPAFLPQLRPHGRTGRDAGS